MNWRTYAVCKEKSLQNEVKCYVYDNQGLRRDLTPLIKPNAEPYQVLSANKQDFYINVCSGVSGHCSESETGACLKTGDKLVKVGDYRFSSLEFKPSSGVSVHDSIEMTYKTKSSDACPHSKANYTSVTTIRFICPPKGRTEYVDRNPILVSSLDCEYQIEWMTEYACPLNTIKTSASSCQLTEESHGIDFSLKSLMKTNDFYRIENITINETNSQSLYDLEFNVCGGLGEGYYCGEKNWKSSTVCLKPKDKTLEDKVIGVSNDGSLKLVDNRLLLEYRNKDNNCKFGNNMIAETTLIEFICDDSKGFEFNGKPEFVSFKDCTYFIVWKTSVVCPAVSAVTPCVATFKNLTFDLSVLRRSYGSDPWTATVSQTLPWSRHAKDIKDTIYLNICGVLPKTLPTKSCDGRSSACMTIGDTNASINLGIFDSKPFYNEDIKAIELIYDNGFDDRNKQKIKSKVTLHCKPGLLDSGPVLVDIDEEQEHYTYHFEWYTWAACPINPFVGNDCKVYDSFLDYTFDLSQLRSKTPFLISTEEHDYQINVCGEVENPLCKNTTAIRATGPVGACQLEKGGQKRVFSLGKVSSTLTYWNGVINLTLTDGTPYNNPEKTPRKSHIAFICDPNVGEHNGPEYDGERERSYFFRWYTPLVCPQTPKTVHCVWDNGTHFLDLTPLSMTSGNHVAVGMGGTVPAIYYINVCRPLNPVHNENFKACGRNSAACKTVMDGSNQVLSLGEATRPPVSGFGDGKINLIYENGSQCPSDPKRNISTRMTFECDPTSDLNSPTVYEPGTHSDGDQCVYLIEWRTAAVCNVIKPVEMDADSCVFTDEITGLSVDLGRLKQPHQEPYKVERVAHNHSSFELNVCGLSNAFKDQNCFNSAVCYRSNVSSQSVKSVNYGQLTSSSFYYDRSVLRLKYSNGSKCHAHYDQRMNFMSSEILFKCNPEAKESAPKLHSTHGCVAVFDWETDLVCNLRPPKCSIVSNKKFYNLRQLSSLTHFWNTSDSEGNIYLLNVCGVLPKSIQCQGSDKNSGSCKCRRDSHKNLICSESLGDPSEDELQVLPNEDLLLTYKNGDSKSCELGATAQTQITFKCHKTNGMPKFKEFVKKDCIYKFEWKTYIACPINGSEDILLPEKNGFLHDKRLDIFINMGPLIGETYNVSERRVNKENKTDIYDYIINLSTPQITTVSSKCSNAAVCQTKEENGFKRDIGSINSIKYVLKGQDLLIVLESTTGQKCGRNINKNVSTIFRLQCSSLSGVGKPMFEYESDDCDYLFRWDTQQVCPQSFFTKEEFDKLAIPVESSGDINTSIPYSEENPKSKSKSSVWIGVVIIGFFVVTLCILLAYKQRVRY